MNKLKKMFHSNFAKSIAMISGSAVTARILSFIFYPVITRIYTPEQYGILAVYGSIVGLIASVASLNYEWAIPIAEDDEKAVGVMQVSFVILSFFSILVFLTFSIFGGWILNTLNAYNLSKYIYLIPIGVFLGGSYNILIQWAYRKKDFKSISTTRLLQSIVGSGAKIVLGLLGTGLIGLIVGQILFQCAGVYTFLRAVMRDTRESAIWKKWHRLTESAKRYSNFAVFSAPSTLLNALGLQLPVLFMTSFYGSEVVGHFGLANSVVSLPMLLIGAATTDVLYAEAASVGRRDPRRVKELSRKVLKSLLLATLVPFLIVLLFGPPLFSFFFGSKWYESGVYARIIAFMAFFKLLVTPVTTIFRVFERLKQQFFLDLIKVIMVLAAFIIVRLLNLSSYAAVALYTICMCIVYFVSYILVEKVLGQEINKMEQAK
ncbi:MAG: oligosaccharide flippase family protein [Candidatus Hydrothermae bacterium]|nr:oligosaccharide flippase family protein [Candidatus Hydrothermae bacterium]HOK22787.1 oligosaccharide flippase family protein [Candidatus Hydrothermia bacterium]HOL23496.1 oligosaccharide flippase family protein [Candidatus Hydrothermia bacterium]HPO78503.1 oligosaccharide flippase family protein [Candidatus Hydrothermia bacterium]